MRTQGRKCFFWLRVWERYSPSVRGKHGDRHGRFGCWSRKLLSHRASTLRTQGENRKWDSAVTLQTPSPPNDLLPPVRLYLLRVLEPSKTASPAGDQQHNTSHSNQNINFQKMVLNWNERIWKHFRPEIICGEESSDYLHSKPYFFLHDRKTLNKSAALFRKSPPWISFCI